MPIQLGPYDLDGPLGRGGMGEVWAGVHRQLRVPVAIKFLTASGLRERDFVRAFRAEVRAVAALDHPAIVQVHDFGEVSDSTARATKGQVPSGSPWLAMERVGGGTLAPLVGRLRWNEVRSVVLSLLDALAHAHARGVVHRDLKPGNVLVVEQDDTDSLLVKLTDFGLAQAVDDRGELDIPFAGGTPAYMAPEQFESRWRDYGPWSDLYALGTLVWSLVTGSPPFGRSGAEKRQQHLNRTPPPLRPTCNIPKGLDLWLRRLLEKDPARRFRRAADARYAFTALGTASEPPRATPVGPQADVDTLVLSPGPEVQRLAEVPTLTFDEDPSQAVHLPIGTLHVERTPMPPTWNTQRTEPQAVSPMGLGLFGLRPVPLVDRRTERDALWQSLVRTERTGKVHCVVVRGASGTGKTRLARWLAERAHELGGAGMLWARHRAAAGPDQGLGPMLRGYLRCHGLDREHIRSRVGAIYRSLGVEHRDEWHALTEVLCPAAEEDTAEVRFGSPMERYVTMRRLLQRICLERPMVMVLDDGSYGVDALRFADYLLGYRARAALPVLVVITVTDEHLTDRLDASTLVEELLARDRCLSLSLGPLPPVHRPALIQGILGLEPDLAARVDAHTRGNPLFAVELVGDWVQDGLLEPSSMGFRALRPIDLPADVRAMWRTRVQRFDEHLNRAESHALELAAVLGVDVDAEEWVGACARAERADPSDGLVRLLLKRGLAETSPERSGWSFTHHSLRESVVRRAETAGRLKEWHRLVAELLQDRVRTLPSWPRGLAERVGKHWLGAGEPTAALNHLLDGILERRHAGDYAVAERLLTAYEEALRTGAVPDSDPRWGHGWVQRYEIAHHRGRKVDAERWLHVASEEARRQDWPQLLRRTQHFKAHLQRVHGDYEGAMASLKKVEQASARAGDREIMARCRQEAGETLLESGDLPGAEHWLRQALAEYRSLGNDLGCARTWRRLGDTLKERGAYDEANELLLQAERQMSALGHREGTASALNSRGDVARATGDLRLAAKLYRRSRGLFKAIGSQGWIYPEYNAAIVHLDRGDLVRARPVIELSLHRFAQANHQPGLAHAHLAMACCAGAVQDWDTWDGHVHQARVVLGRTGYADEDTASLAFRAGEGASDGGASDRARNAWSLSRSLWRILDRSTELHRVERLLSRLDNR